MTQDDGMSWQALSGEYHYLRLASIGPATYALRGTGYESDVHLIVSTDGLRTWQVRDQALQARTGQTVNAFWLNPHTGALLARVGEYGNSGTLWTSADGGADWAPLPMAPPLPSTSEATNSLAVQPPMGDGPWHLCIAQQVGPSTASGSGANADGAPGAANQVVCTSDGGQSWQNRPSLNIPVVVPSGVHSMLKGASEEQQSAPRPSISHLHLMGLAVDGSLLAAVGDGVQAQTKAYFWLRYGLYRLAPHATLWQSLGELPDVAGFVDASYPEVQLAPDGLLWRLQGQGTDAGTLRPTGSGDGGGLARYS